MFLRRQMVARLRQRHVAAQLDELEDALILSDLGPRAAARIRERLEGERFDRGVDETGIRQAMAEEMAAILRPVARPLDIVAFPRPQVVLVIGVVLGGAVRPSEAAPQTYPAGSLIIPMDTDYQNAGMLKARYVFPYLVGLDPGVKTTLTDRRDEQVRLLEPPQDLG